MLIFTETSLNWIIRMAILGNDKQRIGDTEDDNAFHSFLKLKL